MLLFNKVMYILYLESIFSLYFNSIHGGSNFQACCMLRTLSNDWQALIDILERVLHNSNQPLVRI